MPGRFWNIMNCHKGSSLTTLCYIEQDGKYLMLHRVKKENDINKDKWIGVGGHFEAAETPEEHPDFFSLKLRYEGDVLAEAVLDGTPLFEPLRHK